MGGPVSRGLGLAAVGIRDGVAAQGQRLLPPESGVRADAIELGCRWLALSHDVTGRRGSSKGFSLLSGWMPAYPETTGYVLGTLLAQARRTGNADLRLRAVQMGSWEEEVQLEDGGVIQGVVGTEPKRSIVFNTGMVLHGWIDLAEAGERRFDDAAKRAASFLVRHMTADGTWHPSVEFSGIPHTYNSRVSWAMLRRADRVGDAELEEAALRQLDWVLSQQRENGWFDSCTFKAGTTPSTHGIAYTLRGLLESHALRPDPRYLDAVVRTTEVLMRKLEVLGTLPGSWDSDWEPAAGWQCLTGTVQLGGVWLRLFQETGDARYLNAGVKAVELGARHQEGGPWPAVRGALAGSFPIWGRYAPLQYPNWATKFMVDSLMLREESLAAAIGPRP